MSSSRIDLVEHGLEALPQAVGGQRRLDVEHLVVHGVLQLQAVGVQADASIGVAAWSAILQIALDRASHGSQLASYLMVTTRVQMYFEQEVPV